MREIEIRMVNGGLIIKILVCSGKTVRFYQVNNK